jgi:hypothetical protein
MTPFAGAATAAVSIAPVTGTAALRRFRDLAEEFRRAARDGDAEGMGAILAERCALLGSLGAGDPGPDPARINALKEILDVDRESEAILERRRSEIRDELAALGQDRRGLHGYGAGDARAAWRIDERR